MINFCPNVVTGRNTGSKRELAPRNNVSFQSVRQPNIILTGEQVERIPYKTALMTVFDALLGNDSVDISGKLRITNGDVFRNTIKEIDPDYEPGFIRILSMNKIVHFFTGEDSRILDRTVKSIEKDLKNWDFDADSKKDIRKEIANYKRTGVLDCDELPEFFPPEFGETLKQNSEPLNIKIQM